jgi:hypothetical protein
MCCYACTPKGSRLLDAARMKDYIRQAKSAGSIRTVNFSGGEAMLHYDQLLDCVSYAAGLGLDSTLVTNGFWAVDYAQGFQKMERLAHAGLKDVSVSLDRYHQEYVPLETARAALRILRELGLLSMVTIMDTKDGSCAGTLLDDLRPEVYDLNMILYPLFEAGAAKDNIDNGQFLRLCAAETAVCPYSSDIIVLFDGSLMLCCSQYSHKIPMARLGHFETDSLEQAIETLRHNDFLYVLLHGGFGWYLDAAKALGYTFDAYYGVSCELCHAIFSDAALVRELSAPVKKEADRLRILKMLGKAV